MTSSTEPYFGVFDIFKIGIGPSSSHSVGPMRAAGMFLDELRVQSLFDRVQRVQVELFGSLALTGLGHRTDVAILMGLQGESPETIDPSCIDPAVANIRKCNQLSLGGTHSIGYHEKNDLVFNRRTSLPAHPNGLQFRAFVSEDAGTPCWEATYYSVGGGFVIRDGQGETDQTSEIAPEVPYPFASAKDLLTLAAVHHCSFGSLARANERVFRSDEEISRKLQQIWQTMQQCVHRGCETEGVLPGGLNIVRRAPGLYKSLLSRAEKSTSDPMTALDWVDLYAIAVNEENAAGGRVVTAPTNGAAGIIPAVLHYLVRLCQGTTDQQVEQFLLTAAVIGSLYKRNASISGAEVGCQGEVGVACSWRQERLPKCLVALLSKLSRLRRSVWNIIWGLPVIRSKGSFKCRALNAMRWAR